MFAIANLSHSEDVTSIIDLERLLFVLVIGIFLCQGCFEKQSKSSTDASEEENSDSSYRSIGEDVGNDDQMAEAGLDEGNVSIEENNGLDVNQVDRESGGIGPDRTAWKPPLEEAYTSIWHSEPGYKNSPAPFCASTDESSISQAVWSDSRGVFVLVKRPPQTLIGTSSGESEDELVPQIYLNDGSGWRSVYVFSELYVSGSNLTGFINGPLIVSTAIATDNCTVRLINEEGLDYCTPGSPGVVTSVFAVDDSIAYAIGRDEYVYKYDNNDPSLGWKPYGETLGERGQVFASSLWADSRNVIVGANNRQVFIYREGNQTPERLLGTPREDPLEVWAFSETDIWGYRREELIHYDGSEWEVIWTPNSFELSDECWGQIGIWGSDGVLYFHNKHQFYRWNGSEVELLASWPCDNNFVSIYDIWGNSASEVFLSVSDADMKGVACGDKFILWFDGVSLRQI